MAIKQAQARFYQAFKLRVSDKNVSANLIAEFSMGHTDPDTGELLPNVLPSKTARSLNNTLTTQTSTSVSGSFGQQSAVANIQSMSALTLRFPTFVKLDIDKLELPQGVNVTLQLEPGFVIEQTAKFPFALGAPLSANNNLLTFRTPKRFFSQLLSSSADLNFIPLRIKQLSAPQFNSVSSLLALPIFNPGKLAALFGGNFVTVTNPVKQAVSGASLFASFGPVDGVGGSILATGTRIQQFASDLAAVSQLSLPESQIVIVAEADFTTTTSTSIVALRQRNTDVQVSSLTSMNVDANKTTNVISQVAAQFTQTIDSTRIRPAVSNLAATSSLSVPIIHTPMVFEYLSNQFPNTLGIVLTAPVNAVIEWGDGTQNTYTTGGTKTHTYVGTLTRKITIRGTVEQLSFNGGQGTGSLVGGIRKCTSFGDLGIKNIRFSVCKHLIEVPPKLPSSVISTQSMFQNCETFNDARVTSWNTENVTNMLGMFDNAAAFNRAIGSWNLANVTITNSMFKTATSFNQPIETWNVSNVSNMASMFESATKFNQPLNNWNVSNVADMTRLFLNAQRFNQPLNNWNVSTVGQQFTLPSPPFPPGSTGTGTMQEMFRLTQDFNQDISSWCVQNIAQKPFDFDAQSNIAWTEDKKPNWGAPC